MNMFVDSMVHFLPWKSCKAQRVEHMFSFSQTHFQKVEKVGGVESPKQGE